MSTRVDPASWGADPMVLADAAWKPCYASGRTAANQWGLTEQAFPCNGHQDGTTGASANPEAVSARNGGGWWSTLDPSALLCVGLLTATQGGGRFAV